MSNVIEIYRKSYIGVTREEVVAAIYRVAASKVGQYEHVGDSVTVIRVRKNKRGHTVSIITEYGRKRTCDTTADSIVDAVNLIPHNEPCSYAA